MEIEKNIAIPDSALTIRGLFREVEDAPIVVFAHCFTGSKNSTKYYCGVRALETAGFANYRFDFYGGQNDQRKLLDCTVETHVQDLDLVLETFRQEFPDRKIAVIGHSIGAVVGLMVQSPIDALVLWDPTHSDLWEDDGIEDEWHVWDPRIELFRLKGGVEELISLDMMKSMRSFDSTMLAKAVNVPLLVVAAGGDSEEAVKARSSYADYVGELGTAIVIADTDHNFTVGETLTTLFEETIAWLASHCDQGHPADNSVATNS